MFDPISGHKGFQVHTIRMSAFKQNQYCHRYTQLGIHIKSHLSLLKGSLEVKLSTTWTDEAAERWEE